MIIEATQLLLEAKQALINRDAVKCYDSGEHPCNCTLCKIDRFVEKNNKLIVAMSPGEKPTFRFFHPSEIHPPILRHEILGLYELKDDEKYHLIEPIKTE